MDACLPRKYLARKFALPRNKDTMEEFERRCSVRGYHVYQTIWDAVVGETLECRRQPLNEHNRYAVAVIKDDVIIGHLPRKVSRLCSLETDAL